MSTPTGPKPPVDPATLRPRTPGREGEPAAGPGPPRRDAPRPDADTGGDAAPPRPVRRGLTDEKSTRTDEELRAKLAECTADLQRVKAEYDNYRKRVKRDRMAIRDIAVVNVVRTLLPVLDAITEAREHGEVTGGFEAVARSLQTQLAALGLEAFGEAGDPFDPAHHEALTDAESDQVDRPTCTQILRPGYRVGENLLRPAQVVVAEPPVLPLRP